MHSNNNPADSQQKKPLRLWPGIVLAILMLITRFGLPMIAPGAIAFGVLSGLAYGVAIMIWWAFFSRAPGIDRWGGILLMIIALILTSFFIDVSLATGGQGMMFTLYSVQLLGFVFVLWAIFSSRLSRRMQRLTMVATILLASGIWILIRVDGITGDFDPDLAWRWSKTSEERLLDMDEGMPVKLNATPVILDTIADWPGFRGPNRNGIVGGIQIETDWSAKPPVELWRKPVGPGCSSFAVSGDLIYTQEQRGEDELVSCYNLINGDIVWKHHDKARFWDSHAGAGPRSTPAIYDSLVVTLGATGILNVLKADDGSLVWTRNIISENAVHHSGWGISSSPLVVDDLVIVAAVGKLAAYKINTGEVRWIGPDGGDSYSSPHLFTIGGQPQVLLTSANGLISLTPSDGSLIWEYSWPGESRIVQPAMTSDGDFLISATDGSSLRRISVLKDPQGWSFEEQWTSSKMKPNFNDLIVHKGYAFGFNGSMLVCINTKNGKRKWRGERYGGQLLLLADQDMLLVLSEKGELALVSAMPDKFNEIARLEAIEGKTWNHPVLVRDVLLVRNTQEMVAYQLTIAGS